MKTRTFLNLILISLLALFISACNKGEDVIDGASVTTPAGTQTITGTVTGPNGLITMLENKTLWASALDSVFPLAHAATANGLEPVDGAIIELILIEDADIVDDNDGRGILVGGEVIATATSGADGSFSIDTTETLDDHLVLRVISPDNGLIVMRAIVNGTTVDISPASEYVLREILGAIIGFNGTLEHFRNDEIQELLDTINKVVANMPDMSTRNLESAIDEIGEEAGEDFDHELEAKIAVRYRGRWAYAATVNDGSSCSFIEDYSGTSNIYQEGTQIRMVDVDDTTVVTPATINDNIVTWKVPLVEDLVTGTERGETTVSDDGMTASGTVTFTVTGAGACESTAAITATFCGYSPSAACVGSGIGQE